MSRLARSSNIDGESACVAYSSVHASGNEEGGDAHSHPSYGYQPTLRKIFGCAFQLCFGHNSSVVAVSAYRTGRKRYQGALKYAMK